MQEENAYGQLDPFENLPIPGTEATVKVVTRSRTKPVVDVAEEEKKDCDVIPPPLSHKETEAPVIKHKEEACSQRKRATVFQSKARLRRMGQGDMGSGTVRRRVLLRG